MTMNEFDKVCKYLEDNNYIVTSIINATKKVYMNDDRTLSVTVEVDTNQLSKEDEEKIKIRLKELGYLND